MRRQFAQLDFTQSTRALGVLVALSSSVSRADPWDFLQLIPVSDGNPATNDSGWANAHINAVPFKRQSLSTAGAYQFTSY
jgi:hypothetical protein